MSQTTVADDRRRKGGRATRRALRQSAPIVFLPTLVRKIPVYEVLGQDGVEAIHDASMKILEEVGIEFRDDEALALWRDVGADVKGQRVRIDRALLMELIAKAPESYILHARNSERTVTIGGRHMVFSPTCGSPCRARPGMTSPTIELLKATTPPSRAYPRFILEPGGKWNTGFRLLMAGPKV